MTDIDIKWSDGTTRSVERGAIVVTAKGSVYTAEVAAKGQFVCKAVLAEADAPPLAKPKGIDPKTLKGWTLCEIEERPINGYGGGTFYREVRGGCYRETTERRVAEVPHRWTIVRAIPRLDEGMNLMYAPKDSDASIQFNASSVDVTTSSLGCGHISADFRASSGFRS